MALREEVVREVSKFLLTVVAPELYDGGDGHLRAIRAIHELHAGNPAQAVGFLVAHREIVVAMAYEEGYTALASRANISLELARSIKADQSVEVIRLEDWINTLTSL